MSRNPFAALRGAGGSRGGFGGFNNNSQEDHKVLTSSIDTPAGYLIDKVVGVTGSNSDVLTLEQPGLLGNEIAITARTKIIDNIPDGSPVQILGDGVFGNVLVESYNLNSVLRGKPVQISNRCCINSQTPGPQTSGNTNGNIRNYHYNGNEIAENIRFVYSNHSGRDDTGYLSGHNDITVRAGLELADGTTYPVFFNGKRDVVIQPDGMVISDPVGVQIAAQAKFYTRTKVSVAQVGFTWPRSFKLFGSDGEGAIEDNSTTDDTLSGTIAYNFIFAYDVSAVLGTKVSNMGAIAIVGDSIAAGDLDTEGANGSLGFIEKAFSIRNGVLRCGISGCSYSTEILFQRSFFRRILAGSTNGISSIIANMGMNDISLGQPLASIQTNMITYSSFFRRLGIKYFQCTITPRTTSTDSWATLANQTVVANFDNAGIRGQLNAWILGVGSNNFDGVIDSAAAITDAATGKWIANGTPNFYTIDGINAGVNSTALMTAVLVAFGLSKFDSF